MLKIFILAVSTALVSAVDLTYGGPYGLRPSNEYERKKQSCDWNYDMYPYYVRTREECYKKVGIVVPK